ncbi:phosphoglucosamine mutase [Parelusimicrobium proximum]|uniref:phosphoglucosamine mutase n=1 Tax=Parelusimicrobium proximum TaxID=3228953 RepID=UPI003D17A10B
MGKYFGTDGIRAVAGEFPLTKEFIEKLGYAAVKEISKTITQDLSKTVIIGEDTRQSGRDIAQYLTNGIKAAGFNVVNAGVLPTPAVSFLVQKNKAAFGAVISASHNPAEFNGIKFFDHTGKKLPETIENKVEESIESSDFPVFKTESFEHGEKALEREYIDFLKSTVPADIFKGKKIVLDCANGATYSAAPEVFKELGAEISVIGNTPDGLNINKDIGALHTEKMQALTKSSQADIGFSFDGDGDRVIASDGLGRQLDGDNIISACAVMLKKLGRLNNNGVVMTIMANLAVINFLKEQNITEELTKVGDKYVAEAMVEKNFIIGGETSGHIILNEFEPTGDGMLAAIQLLALACETNTEINSLKDMWHKYPAKLTAIRASEKIPLDTLPSFTDLIKELEADFGNDGRIVIRYSGTEPVLRILVEGKDEQKVAAASEKLGAKFKETAGIK